MSRRLYLILFSCAFGFLLAGGMGGCNFFLREEEVIELSLPALPQPWMGQQAPSSYELVYAQAGVESSLTVPYSAGRVRIPVSLGKTAAFVLYPRVHLSWEGGEHTEQEGAPGSIVTLFPAGGLYPDFMTGGRLHASWEDGFAAETLLLLARSGFSLDRFNCARFFEESRKRGAPNPWNLNRARILETLSTGSFRADRIVLRKQFQLTLPFTPGVWFGKSLLEPPLTVGEEGVYQFEGLSWGMHRYWQRGRMVTIQVSEEGRALAAEYTAEIERITGAGSEIP